MLNADCSRIVEPLLRPDKIVRMDLRSPKLLNFKLKICNSYYLSDFSPNIPQGFHKLHWSCPQTRESFPQVVTSGSDLMGVVGDFFSLGELEALTELLCKVK